MKEGEKVYYQFRNIIKETKSRGWRLETNEEERIYLSKFEELFNDNEIRVYISIDQDGVHIDEMIKIKSDGTVSNIKENNKYVKKALEICDLYWEKHQNDFVVAK